MGKQKKQLAYVIYPGINLLDLVGPFYVMNDLMTAGYESFTSPRACNHSIPTRSG
jgi:hypothetical protein